MKKMISFCLLFLLMASGRSTTKETAVMKPIELNGRGALVMNLAEGTIEAFAFQLDLNMKYYQRKEYEWKDGVWERGMSMSTLLDDKSGQLIFAADYENNEVKALVACNNEKKSHSIRFWDNGVIGLDESLQRWRSWRKPGRQRIDHPEEYVNEHTWKLACITISLTKDAYP